MNNNENNVENLNDGQDKVVSLFEPVKAEEIMNKVNTLSPISVETNHTKKNGKKKNKAILFGGIVIVLMVLIGVVFIYFTVMNQGSRVFVKMMDSLKTDFQYFTEPLNNTVMVSDDFTMNGEMKMNLQSDFLSQMEVTEEDQMYLNLINSINQMKFPFSYQQSSNSGFIFQMKLDGVLSDEKLFGIVLLLAQNEEYILLENIYDRYLKIPLEESIDMTNTTKDIDKDFEYLYDFTVQSLFMNLKNDYFEKENVSITLDGEEKDVNRITLTVDDKNFGSIMDGLVSDMKDDQKVMDILKKWELSLDEYETPSLDGETIVVRMYQTKFMGDLVGYEMSASGIRISYIDQENDTFEIYDENENKLVVRAVVDQSDKGYDVVFTQWDETELGHISVVNKDDASTVSFDFSMQQVVLNGTIISKVSEVEKDKKYSTTSNVSMNVTAAGMKIATLGFDVNGTLENGTTMTNPDVSNAILIDEITEEEYTEIGNTITQIMERLMGNVVLDEN